MRKVRSAVMSLGRMVIIGCIFALAAAGWWVLGTVTAYRSDAFSSRLGTAVESLWGEPVIQREPTAFVQIPGTDETRRVLPTKNEIRAGLDLEHRRKGLIWYAVYFCDFEGTYTFRNAEAVAQKVQVRFDFPSRRGTFNNVAVSVDGTEIQTQVSAAEGIRELMEIAPGQERTFSVRYRRRGTREWRYRPDGTNGRVLGLNAAVTTNFHAIDFPDGTIPPRRKDRTDDGYVLTWDEGNILTTDDIAVTMPQRINPGPLAGRMTFFAPICLLFFFVLVGTINIIKRIEIHPMHYLFVAAGFFAFHLLFAYLVDHINVHAAFVVATVASVGLVTSYLAAALKGRLPWKVAAAGQMFYLVLFSDSFFLKGMSGLTGAVGSVVTLAVLMKLTAHIDWNEVFGAKPGRSPAAPPAGPAPEADLPTVGG